ncbi:MAG TPA: hypothetical protein VGR35_02540 [Tepidisphaeraceae bacterium]|nr:hypothetical protein [Tepidisphaeraceae bacterium]
MYWIIRWTDREGDDQAIVVEAESRVVAWTIALKRDIPVVVVEEASDSDVAAARDANRLWQYTRPAQHMCFGRPVATRQVACLMLCGVWTIGALLQSSGVLAFSLRLPL